MESRINTIHFLAPDRVRKEAGPLFKRGNYTFDPKRLLKREAAFLDELEDFPHFPRVLEESDDSFTMEYVGERINPANLPSNWKIQADAILSALKEKQIVHRDIKAINLVVKDGIISLIDFGWAYHEGETPYPCPQDLCKDIEQRAIYDNRYALIKTLKELAGEA